MFEFIFWVSFFFSVYIYFGYPALIGILSLFNNKVEKNDRFPAVSILIAAFNEERDIEKTILNKLSQNYPENLIEILVVSDESEDKTDEIVMDLSETNNIPIHLVRQVPRRGKTSGLNMLVPMAKGEIIIFSDANSVWSADAIRKLVQNFSDPEVGYVTGKMVYTNEDGSLVGDGCSAYMKYENWMRAKETLVGSIVGVDGGIDAMRRELYDPLRADQLPDFVQPLKVVEKGYRVVYESEALLKEEALQDSESEFSMRVRVTLRALWALKDMKHLLNPVKYGIFSFELLSHKVMRYFAFIPMLILATVSLILLDNGGWYTFIALAQIIFYTLAGIGHARKESGSLPIYLSIPYYFSLLNVACFKATSAFLKGEKKVIWTPRKG